MKSKICQTIFFNELIMNSKPYLTLIFSLTHSYIGFSIDTKYLHWLTKRFPKLLSEASLNLDLILLLVHETALIMKCLKISKMHFYMCFLFVPRIEQKKFAPYRVLRTNTKWHVDTHKRPVLKQTVLINL